jgi:hypothetical protein
MRGSGRVVVLIHGNAWLEAPLLLSLLPFHIPLLAFHLSTLRSGLAFITVLLVVVRSNRVVFVHVLGGEQRSTPHPAGGGLAHHTGLEWGAGHSSLLKMWGSLGVVANHHRDEGQ